MTKHKLDLATEDILQHYGIKGMKWDVRRTEEELAAARGKAAEASEALENAGDEVFGNESIGEELGDVFDIIFGGEGDLAQETYELYDATKDKLEDVSADIKKRGSKMLERMFGKSNAKTTIKNPITGKEQKVKKSDIVPIKNPLTGKPITINTKDGEMTLSRKKFKKNKGFSKEDREKLKLR